MRILVYGAGVLGGNLANNLYRAGRDVTLLARGQWAETIRENGLVVKSILRPKATISRIPVITELAPDDVYDVIFVVMRYTQLDGILGTLRANASRNIVFVGNNVRPRDYAALLPDQNVLFAFALSAGHREADRIVDIDLKKITIGQLRDAASNEALIHEIFDGTGYKVVYQPNTEDYLLCHASYVVPIANACYYVDGDLGRLRGDKVYVDRVIDATIEGYRAIENAGHEILPEDDRNYESAAYRRFNRIFFWLMCVTPLGKVCASDHAMNAVEEMSALNRDLKRFYDANGADYPAWQEIERSAARYLDSAV